MNYSSDYVVMVVRGITARFISNAELQGVNAVFIVNNSFPIAAVKCKLFKKSCLGKL